MRVELLKWDTLYVYIERGGKRGERGERERERERERESLSLTLFNSDG